MNLIERLRNPTDGLFYNDGDSTTMVMGYLEKQPKPWSA